MYFVFQAKKEKKKKTEILFKAVVINNIMKSGSASWKGTANMKCNTAKARRRINQMDC